jgi:hypothetical protein
MKYIRFLNVEIHEIFGTPLLYSINIVSKHLKFFVDFITWHSNVKLDLKEIGYEGVDCVHFALDWVYLRALVNMVMCLSYDTA